jgi:hypothetical protein
MNWKAMVTDEPLISEKAKEYFADAAKEKRRKIEYFQTRFDGVWE